MDGLQHAQFHEIGEVFSACPWWSYQHPIVGEVLTFQPLNESGQLDFATGGECPSALVDALIHYQRAVGACSAAETKRRDAERKPKAGEYRGPDLVRVHHGDGR